MTPNPNLNPKVQKIINWRESLSVLPDSHFFEIIRMYLGEVKTPFNKQKLIEELSAFIRKPATRKTIISLLSETDLQLICAVKFIPNATEEKLASFFGNEFKFSELYNRLLNLEERLIIYRHKDKISGKMIISLNPHLEDDFAPFAKKSVLLKLPELAETNFDSPSALSPELIASFVAFINKNPDLCKADGTFKKRIESEIKEIFPKKTQMLFALTKAFVNLSLLRETSNGYEIDRNRFFAFAKLDERLQYAYLAVSAHGRFSRSELVRQAKLLIDSAYSIPESGFSKSVLLRLAYLIAEDQNDAPGISSIGGKSRFQEILNRARNSQSSGFDKLNHHQENRHSEQAIRHSEQAIRHSERSEESLKRDVSYSLNMTGRDVSPAPQNDNNRQSQDLSSVLDRLVDVAEIFGILRVKGTDVNGEKVYVCGDILRKYENNYQKNRHPELVSGPTKTEITNQNARVRNDDVSPKVLSIDAGFNVTILPGLPLRELLPLMDFMELVQFDTAARFEITRKSAMRGFDFGLTSQKIIELLQKYSPYEVPQNLEVSLEDWSNSYSSASIFKGYVLKVNEKNAAIIEKNPAVAPFISAKLGNGIYLLSAEDDEEAAEIVQKSGLDFIGKIKTAEKSAQAISFPEFAIQDDKDCRVKPDNDTNGKPDNAIETADNDTNRRSEQNFRHSERSEESQKLQNSENVVSTKLNHHDNGINFPANEEERKNHFYEMRSALEKLDSQNPMSPEQKEGLLQRIEHKIILTTEQLRPTSVRFERIEATGMDYSGKLHIIEGSVTNNSLVELHYDSGIIIGKPISVTKTESDANVLMEVLPDHSQKLLSVAQAKFVKRIGGSVLER